jgi:hypothetical protein
VIAACYIGALIARAAEARAAEPPSFRPAEVN